MAKQFQDILDECIIAVLDGGESIDSCCSRYPDWADELRPMLQIMAQGHQALQATASAEAKEAGRARVLASSSLLIADCKKERRKSFITMPRFFLKPVALAVGLMLLLFGGTALAASGAGPDSFLYPVKRGLEEVRTAVAIQDVDRAKVDVDHADTRLDEIVEMVDEEKAEYVPELLGSYDTHMDDTADHIFDAARDGEDTSEVEAMMMAVQGRHDEIMLEIEGRVPEEVRREIADHIDEAERHSSSGGYNNDGSGSGEGGMQDSDGEAEDGDFNTPGGSGYDGEDGADDGPAVPPGEPDGDDNPAPPGDGDNGSVNNGGNGLPGGDGGGGQGDNEAHILDPHTGEAAGSSTIPPENQPGV